MSTNGATTTAPPLPESITVGDASSTDPLSNRVTKDNIACPYLDTINRTLLDFDFEHSCSVSLQSGPHVYACLVCGKFFRGRGPHTPARTHSVEAGHFVFVHLSRGTFHCLPDDYEIKDEPSLADIGQALRPTFSEEEVRSLDGDRDLARDLFGRRYLPGFVGLNNLNKTDYLNAVVQALAHVRPVRDFLLRGGKGKPTAVGEGGNGAEIASSSSLTRKRKKRREGDPTPPSPLDPSEFSPLAHTFGALVRSMWSPHRFKSNVDPHMLVQAVSVASDKRFHVGKQAEAGEFLAWLLHQLHVGMGGGPSGGGSKKKKGGRRRRRGGTVIHEAFLGKVEVTTVVTRRRKRGQTEAAAALTAAGTESDTARAEEEEDMFADDDDRAGSDDEDTVEQKRLRRERLCTLADEVVTVEETSTLETDFLQLTLDIPEKPLFKDDDGGLVIPQEPLVNVLRKFDGVSFCDALAVQSRGGGVGKGDDGSGGGGVVVSKKRRYRLKRLPNYLILHLSRFKKNNFSVEKNPTIVMFPVKNFDLSGYVFPEGGREKVPTEEEVRGMSSKELKNMLKKHDRSDLADYAIERSDLVQSCIDFVTTSLPELLLAKYDLVANITHDIPAEVGREGQRDPLEEGSYRCHVQHRASGQWYEMHDLHVRETMPQLIGVSESYILIFERKGI